MNQDPYMLKRSSLISQPILPKDKYQLSPEREGENRRMDRIEMLKARNSVFQRFVDFSVHDATQASKSPRAKTKIPNIKMNTRYTKRRAVSRQFQRHSKKINSRRQVSQHLTRRLNNMQKKSTRNRNINYGRQYLTNYHSKSSSSILKRPNTVFASHS